MELKDIQQRFRVVRLAREELKEQCSRDDYEQWGAPELVLAQYERLELRKRRTTQAQRRSVFWALVQRGEAEGGGDSDAGLEAGKDLLVCHCECYRFDCALRRRSGEVVRGFSHHIGAVFTLPAFRKQGLAAYFLTEVRSRMAMLEKTLLSILYSDIGPIYYDRLGWRVYPSTVAALKLDDPKNAKAATASCVPESYGDKLFLDDKLSKLLVADNERLVERLGWEQFSGQEAFVVLPTRDSIEWQFCVGVYYAEVQGFDELPKQCGVKAPDVNAFVIWCHDFKESTLDIIRYDFGEGEEVARLLLVAALQEARKFRLSRVAIWNPPEILLSNCILDELQVTFSDREDSLSSAMIFGQSDRVETPPAIWLANERYGWV